jgi:metallo-beta-lactamase class B
MMKTAFLSTLIFARSTSAGFAQQPAQRLSGMVKQPNQPLTVHVAAHTIFNGLMEARDRLLARKPGEPNPLVDPDTLLKMLATQRSRAEVRLEIERKAGR